MRRVLAVAISLDWSPLDVKKVKVQLQLVFLSRRHWPQTRAFKTWSNLLSCCDGEALDEISYLFFSYASCLFETSTIC
jgi:hypothetical protein